jgi:hypothetical protein
MMKAMAAAQLRTFVVSESAKTLIHMQPRPDRLFSKFINGGMANAETLQQLECALRDNTFIQSLFDY